MATIDEKAMNGADLKRFAALIKKTASQSAHGMMSKTDKAKLDGIAAGAEVNVQADWNVTDSSSDAFVKNKPTIDTALSGTSTNAVQNKVVKAALDTKVNTSDLASVTEDSEGADLVGYGTKTDGGTTTNVSVKDALDEIYESIGDGGDLATRVTALEEGKEDKFFIITVTAGYNSQTDKYTILSCDRTMAEMTEAYAADKKMLVLLKKGTVTYLVPLTYADEKDGKEHVNNFYFVGYSNKKDESVRCIFPGTVAEAMVEITRLQTRLTFDDTPTENSNNPVKSGGVYTALQDKQDSDFIVTFTYGNSQMKTISSIDKTFAEILEAYNAGKTIVAKAQINSSQNDHYFLPLVEANLIDLEEIADFTFESVIFGHRRVVRIDNENNGYAENEEIDYKVAQLASNDNADFPMLLRYSADPNSSSRNMTNYDTDLTYNPSTNTLKLGTGTLTATNYSGNAATATNATNATNDGSGNNIANTYALKTDVMNPHPTIVTTLPTADGTHHGFYFVKDTSSTRENVYTEYIEVQENSTWKWEPIGSTDVTLDVAYLTTTEVETIWNDTSWT